MNGILPYQCVPLGRHLIGFRSPFFFTLYGMFGEELSLQYFCTLRGAFSARLEDIKHKAPASKRPPVKFLKSEKNVASHESLGTIVVTEYYRRLCSSKATRSHIVKDMKRIETSHQQVGSYGDFEVWY